MRFTIRKVDIADLLVQKAIHSLLDDTFSPGEWDAAPRFTTGYWWVAYCDGEAAAFAGLVPSSRVPNAGYLKASGVLPKFRGHGLQKRLIRKRLDHARSLGWTTVFTETINHNAPSGNSLISCGFRMFNPKHPWGSSYAVYWKKELR